MGATESTDPLEAEYLSWPIEGMPLEVRIHSEVVAGIAREVRNSGDGEVDGALRGRHQTGKPDVVWIERYQPLQAVADTPEDTVGFYRGTASRAGFPDADNPPHSLLMAVLPDETGALTAQFSLPGADGQLTAVLPVLPFGPRAQTRPGRLVPDFDPAVAPAQTARDYILQTPPRSQTPQPAPENRADPGAALLPEDEDDSPTARHNPPSRSPLKRYWPVFAVLALLGAGLWAVPWWLSRRPAAPAPAATSSTFRPLGLYVDPSSPGWRISWNRDASVLQGATQVRLFIHDGDDQNGIDLSPTDLESGNYPYQPRTRDVIIRMEATGADGRVSAESFRLLVTDAGAANDAGQRAPSTSLPPRAPEVAAPAPPATESAGVAPQAIRRVAPVVSASVRPRIHGKVLIDVRVQVNTRGRVTSATPSARPHGSLEGYLASSAVRAARAWRFTPAVRDGRAVAGTQTLHFVFER